MSSATREGGPARRSAQREGGFSLIEVLIAAGLLATGIGALLQLFVVAARANLDARHTTYATVLAAQKVEELRAAPFPGPTASSDALDRHGTRLVEGVNAPEALYERRWTVEPLPAQPAETVVITVVVSRRGLPDAHAVHLTTFRTRRGV